MHFAGTDNSHVPNVNPSTRLQQHWFMFWTKIVRQFNLVWFFFPFLSAVTMGQRPNVAIIIKCASNSTRKIEWWKILKYCVPVSSLANMLLCAVLKIILLALFCILTLNFGENLQEHVTYTCIEDLNFRAACCEDGRTSSTIRSLVLVGFGY